MYRTGWLWSRSLSSLTQKKAPRISANLKNTVAEVGAATAYPCHSATLFCLVFITDRRPHSHYIYRRRPSLSGCRCSHLEQFTPARHLCAFVACLPVTPQDSSLQYFLSQSVTMYGAGTVTLVISDTLVVHVS